MGITADYKAEIERKIVEIMIASLSAQTLEENDLPLIARYVLETLPTVETYGDMFAFVATLADTWPLFQPLQTIVEGKEKELEEQDVTHDVLQLAKQGNVEQALSLAKSMTHTI